MKKLVILLCGLVCSGGYAYAGFIERAGTKIGAGLGKGIEEVYNFHVARHDGDGWQASGAAAGRTFCDIRRDPRANLNWPTGARRAGLVASRAAFALLSGANWFAFIKALKGNNKFQLMTLLQKKFGWDEQKSGKVVRWMLRHKKFMATMQLVAVEVGLLFAGVMRKKRVYRPGEPVGSAGPRGLPLSFEAFLALNGFCTGAGEKYYTRTDHANSCFCPEDASPKIYRPL